MSSFKWICGVFFLHVLSSVYGIHFTLDDGFECQYATDLTVGNRTRELECCDNMVEEYHRHWFMGRSYLTGYLEALQTWKCPEYEIECQRQTFAYTDFTSLVYTRFCNNGTLVLEEKCYEEVRSVVEKQGNVALETSTWTNAVNSLDLSVISDEDLLKPCLQIAMYDIDSGGNGHYHEVVEPIAPFCSFVWCGFDENIVSSRHISAWTCMPSRCRSSVIVVMVIFGLLAVATFVCNATILGVLLFNKKLQNGQAIYRLSLAFADIIVGAIVFPTFISTLNKYFISRHELGELKNVTGYVITNDDSGRFETSMAEVRDPSGLFRNRFSRTYLNAVGFFTVLSLSVSVYSLVAASVDRFVAVNRPLKYNQKKAAYAARVAVVSIWIAGFLLSTFPFYVSNLQYGVIAAILVSSGGTEVLILYSIAFFIPLIIVWILTIITFVIAKKNASEWSTRTRENDQSQMALEMRLVRTLSIMVGVFTLCLLPAALVLLVALALPDIYYNQPLLLNEQSASSYTTAEAIVVLLLTSNSLWNCFIYSARDPKFRSASKTMYGNIAVALRLTFVWRIITGQNNLENQRRESQPIRQESMSSAATEATKVYYKNNHVDIQNNATNNH